MMMVVKEKMPEPSGGYSISHSCHGAAKMTPLLILDDFRTCIAKRKHCLNSCRDSLPKEVKTKIERLKPTAQKDT